MFRSRWSIIILLLIILLIVFILALSVGTAYVPVHKILHILAHSENNSPYAIIIKEIRLPRVILSIMVGAGLAMSGVIFQGIIRNPLVDPYIVGISAGAGTGVTLAIILNISWTFLWFETLPLLAFIGAMVTVYLVYGLARVQNKVSVVNFLLAGVAMSFVLNALMSFLMVIGNKDLQKIVYWLMGSLASGGWHEIKIITPYYLIGIIFIIFYLKDLNIILLGEESAQHLGVDVEKAKKVLITGASLLTAAAVSVSGSIGFIGLVIPHISRFLVGPDHRRLLPFAALLGSIFLVISDTLARSLLPPLEIPVGILTALAGGPYFVYLLRSKQNESW